MLRTCEKVPVVVNKDTPGQLGNRMHMALIRETAHLHVPPNRIHSIVQDGPQA